MRARHHAEAGQDRGRRHAGAVCSRATAAAIWRRCSSTSRAGAAKRGRRRNERAIAGIRRLLAAPRRRDGAAHWYLLQLVLAALFDLIYWPTVQMLMWGFLQLYVAQHSSFFAQAGGHLHRRGDAVGHPVPRPARLFDLVSRRDVCAQPRQPDDEPAAADRVRRRADDHEHHPACDRHGAGDAARDRVLRLQSVGHGASRSRCSSSICC